MGFFGLLILSFGAFGFAAAVECVNETARCSQYWEKIEPHTNLFETESQLDAWCGNQTQFYGCLDEVLLADHGGNLSYLPTNLLVSRLFSNDLCLKESKNRKRLLESASCVNALNTDFCAQREFIDIVTPEGSVQSSTCSQYEKIFSCIAATMISYCGFDAGKVYRALLKITRYSDEVCDIELSKGIPQCQRLNATGDDNTTNPEISIFYGLVDRIGSIPEQEIELPENSILSKETVFEEVGDVEVITEAVKSVLDFLSRNEISEESSFDESREAEDLLSYTIEGSKESREAEDVSYTTEGSEESREAEDLSYTTEDSEESREAEDLSSNTESSDEVVKDLKLYKKYPKITQIYRDFLFYNYSDGAEYAAYWRQPDFTMVENVSCEHLQPSYLKGVVFRCIIEYRFSDPYCLFDAAEPVTPELVRDVDPEVPDDSIIEFAPRPHWMKSMDDAQEANRLRDLLKSTTTTTTTTTQSPKESSAVTDFPILGTTSATVIHIAEAFTKSSEVNWWEATHKTMLADDIKKELMEIFMPEPEKFVPPPMNMFQVSNTMYFLIYDPFTNVIENLTCSRVNECHPRGRGLWKCSMSKREIIPCDVCGKGGQTPDPTQIHEGSGVEHSDELVTLVFSDDVSTEMYPGTDTFYELSAQSNPDDESTYLNDPPSSPEEQDPEGIDGSSAIRLVVLDQDSEVQPDNDSAYIPELVYAINNMEVLDSEQLEEITLSPDNEYGLNGNIIVLQGIPDVDSVESEYAIVNTSDDSYN